MHWSGGSLGLRVRQDQLPEVEARYLGFEERLQGGGQVSLGKQVQESNL